MRKFKQSTAPLLLTIAAIMLSLVSRTPNRKMALQVITIENQNDPIWSNVVCLVGLRVNAVGTVTSKIETEKPINIRVENYGSNGTAKATRRPRYDLVFLLFIVKQICICCIWKPLRALP